MAYRAGPIAHTWAQFWPNPLILVNVGDWSPNTTVGRLQSIIDASERSSRKWRMSGDERFSRSLASVLRNSLTTRVYDQRRPTVKECWVRWGWRQCTATFVSCQPLWQNIRHGNWIVFSKRTLWKEKVGLQVNRLNIRVSHTNACLLGFVQSKWPRSLISLFMCRTKAVCNYIFHSTALLQTVFHTVECVSLHRAVPRVADLPQGRHLGGLRESTDPRGIFDTNFCPVNCTLIKRETVIQLSDTAERTIRYCLIGKANIS